MALTDFDEYIDKLKENRTADFQMTGTTARSLRANAIWQQTLPTPATPTTSVARDKDSAQSMGPIPDISTGILRLLGARVSTGIFGAAGLIAVDLLNVSGGLSGTVTTAQTTNLPTAALTRHTTGEGVMAGIVIYTTVGTTGTTISINYTNQAGTSGRVSTVTSFGATGLREGNILIIIPLAAGDTGVQSIESVTVTATTGTAGNFGVCMFKPLAMVSLESASGTMPLDAVSSGGIIGSLCEINPDACLTFVSIPATTTSQSIAAALILGEV
jgi:hypothetical protein